MKLSLRKVLVCILMVCAAVCLALGICSCSSCGDHNFSTDWSYDNEGHWHACLDDGCDEKADYEEHTPVDEGYSDGTTIYYTCEVCDAEYTSSLATYIINVLNIGNAGVSGVSVKLYDASGSLVGSGTSASNGVVRFRNLSLADYTATIDATTIPNGYGYDDESDLFISLTATTRSSSIYLTPHLITDTAITSSTSFKLGSVMYDFEATVYYNDGSSETKKLSDYLAEYDAVVLNFFFTTCSPCQSEFPYMNQAYNTTLSSTTGDYYYKNIAMIEVDYTGRDTSISYFKNFITGNYGYDNFSYIYDDTTNLVSAFGVSTFPTTVVIDKYGVVAMYDDDGSQPTISYWTALYETYLEENYVPNYASSNSGSSDETTTMEKPDVDMPESGEIANAIVATNAITTTDTFAFSAYDDEYSWPWLISDGTTAKGLYTDYIYTSNSNKLGTYSILVIDVQLSAGQVFRFDYWLETEADGDYLYIQVDTVLQAQLSGYIQQWNTFCYVAQYDGYYQITLTYQKNSSVDEEGDKVYVRNMYLDYSSITGTLATSDLLYNAATAYTTNSTAGSTQSDYGEGIGYANYVTVYLASDGYYRVQLGSSQNESTDPYLLADLYYATPWMSSMSVWDIAYVYNYTWDYEKYPTDTDGSHGILYNNSKYNQAIEDYAWVQQNCSWGYVPVDEYLATILKAVTASYGATSRASDSNQWLEVCRYYIHYGATSSDHDCLSLDNLAAHVGLRMAGASVGTLSSSNTSSNPFTIDVEVVEAVLPRGSYYTFTVTTAGVYTFYTKEEYTDAEGYLRSGDVGVDPYIWITNTTGHLISDASNDNYSLTTYAYYKSKGGFDVYNYNSLEDDTTIYYDNNSYIYVYLEAGDYLLGGAFSYSEDTGAYTVYAEYIGSSYTYLTSASGTDIYTYSYNETTGYTYYIPGVFFGYETDTNGNETVITNIYVDSNNKYYVANKDGTYSPLYVNMTGITWLNSSYSSYTLEQLIDVGYIIYVTYDKDGNVNRDENGSIIYADEDDEGATAIPVNPWTDFTTDNFQNTADYTTMKNYLIAARNNTATAADGTSLTGYVQATTELVNLLNVYINGGTSSSVSDYSSTAWLMTAFYEKTVNSSTYSVAQNRVIDNV